MLRIGHGYDVHRLAEGRKLIIGGAEIPYDRGLDGHSDADVLLHAVCDALLGAAAMGDIGAHFPDTDERYRGISSMLLLAETVSKIKAQGFEPVNIDSTVIAQAPRLAPYIEQMRRVYLQLPSPISKDGAPRNGAMSLKTNGYRDMFKAVETIAHLPKSTEMEGID